MLVARCDETTTVHVAACRLQCGDVEPALLQCGDVEPTLLQCGDVEPSPRYCSVGMWSPRCCSVGVWSPRCCRVGVWSPRCCSVSGDVEPTLLRADCSVSGDVEPNQERRYIEKWDQTGSPEIPDRGETSAIPRPPFGGKGKADNP